MSLQKNLVKKSAIPITTIYRLSYYYRGLLESGLPDSISSQKLAKLTGFSAALVRRDLSYFGRFGIPGKGYPVEELKNKLLKILGIDKKWRMALIGIGNLGSALLKYKGFEKQGFEISAIFDNDTGKIGKTRAGVTIHDINHLEKEVRKEQIEMAIVAVPADAAQKIIDMVVGSGIKAILNFAPVKVNVPDPVSLVNIDFSIELERLSCMVKQSMSTPTSPPT